MKRYIVALIIAVTALAAKADNVAQQINEIKRDAENYIFAESTVKSEDEARANADGLLVSYITDYLEETAPGTQFNPGIAAKFKYLTMKRGSGMRVFAYISKSELSAGSTTGKQVKSRREKEEDEISRSTPTVTPKPKHSTTAETKKPELVVGNANLTQSQQDMIEDLMGAKDMESAMKLLAMYQVMRKVKEYGTLNDVENKEECFWIIGDTNFNVSTVLSPGVSRTNFSTGLTDNLENHRGVPVLWFKIKQL